MKQKKCRVCRELFTPFTTTSVVCGVECASKLAKKKVQDKKDAEFRERKRRFKRSDIGVQKREASKAFNAYIRERDKEDGCISCGIKQGRQFHAGHFKTRGAHPELAFNEDNCHKQCSVCNNHLSGNLVDYRERLIGKIGKKRVLNLEEYHPPIRRTAKDYEDIKIKYRKKLKELKSL